GAAGGQDPARDDRHGAAAAPPRGTSGELQQVRGGGGRGQSGDGSEPVEPGAAPLLRRVTGPGRGGGLPGVAAAVPGASYFGRSSTAVFPRILRTMPEGRPVRCPVPPGRMLRTVRERPLRRRNGRTSLSTWTVASRPRSVPGFARRFPGTLLLFSGTAPREGARGGPRKTWPVSRKPDPPFQIRGSRQVKRPVSVPLRGTDSQNS